MIIKKCRNHTKTNTINTLVNYVEAKAIIDYAEHKTNKTWYINLPNNKELATKILQITQNKNARSKTYKTYHYIVSFRDGEKPSDEVLKSIEQKISDKLGFVEHQRILAVHDDTAHYHMHVVINKIHPHTYNNLTPYNDFFIMDKMAQELEIKFNLQKDNRIDLSKDKKNNKALDFEAHTGLQSLETFIKQNIKDKIQNLLINKDIKTNWQDIHNLLEKYNIEIKEKTNGLIFKDIKTNIQVKASSIDRKFSKGNLEKILGQFLEKQIKNLDKNDLNNLQDKVDVKNEQIHIYDINNAAKEIIEDEKNKNISIKYKKQPMHKNSDTLWQQYQKNEVDKKLQKQILLDNEKEKFNNQLLTLKQLKLQHKKHINKISNNQEKINNNLNIDKKYSIAIHSAKENYQQSKLNIYKIYNKNTWIEFLIKEAQNNKYALKVLQSNLKNKEYKQIIEKDTNKNINIENKKYNESMKFLKQNNEYLGYGIISKNGEIYYKTIDNGMFKIVNDKIIIVKDTKIAQQQALNIAINLFGNELKINGNKQFIQDIKQNINNKEIKIHINNGLNYDR